MNGLTRAERGVGKYFGKFYEFMNNPKEKLKNNTGNISLFKVNKNEVNSFQDYEILNREMVKCRIEKFRRYG